MNCCFSKEQNSSKDLICIGPVLAVRRAGGNKAGRPGFSTWLAGRLVTPIYDRVPDIVREYENCGFWETQEMAKICQRDESFHVSH